MTYWLVAQWLELDVIGGDERLVRNVYDNDEK